MSMLPLPLHPFLHLFLIPGIGPAAILTIIRRLFEQKQRNSCPDWHQAPERYQLNMIDLSSLYTLTTGTFMRDFYLTEKQAQTLVDGLADRALLDNELALLHKHHVSIITLFDATYPSLLRHIHLPPPLLYVHGTLPAPDAPCIAFVGSRKADVYAQRVITNLVPPLVQHGWSIISGGAEGADTMAHQATLEVHGSTVAVMGSGLLRLYPQKNNKLFNRIVEHGGALVSPFSLTTEPSKTTFPARNRIIAGMAQGSVIVQAARKSGALITASFALEQGRQVFAVPGSIFHELSAGCHDLLMQGAQPIIDAASLLENLGYQSTAVFVSATRDVSPAPTEQLENQEPEHVLLGLLGTPCTLDELSLRSGLSLSAVQEEMFMLQLNGKTKQLFSGAWAKI